MNDKMLWKTLHPSSVYKQCLENLMQKRNKKANYSKLDFTIMVLEQLIEHSKESEDRRIN